MINPSQLHLGTSIDVYLDVLRAREKKIGVFSFESSREAERLLNGAIASDPAFAPAYVALADLYLSMTDMGILSVAELLKKARPVVTSALALDQRLANAWLVDAWLLGFDGKPEQADVSRTRAYALEPSHPSVLGHQILRDYWERSPGDVSPIIDNLSAIDPFSITTLLHLNNWYSRYNLSNDVREVRNRLSGSSDIAADFWSSNLYTPLPDADNQASIRTMRRYISYDPFDAEGHVWLALGLLDAGESDDVQDLIQTGYAMDEEHSFVAMVDALYFSYHGNTSDALAIAEKLAQPHAQTRFGSREVALRMLAAQALASNDPDKVRSLIGLYLSVYPRLAEGNLTSHYVWPGLYVKWAHLMAALDLAALYRRSDNIEQSELLLDAVEDELPFWPRRGVFGIGFADAELQAAKGNDAAALAALRRASKEGLTSKWWWILDHSPHFERLREHPEFADTRADFAALAALP